MSRQKSNIGTVADEVKSSRQRLDELDTFEYTGLGTGNFLDLTDTPSSFSGLGLNTLRINSGEAALEFTDDLTLQTTGPRIKSGLRLELYDALGSLHYLEEDGDGVTEGVVLRTSTNPASPGRIFSVQSSGQGDRLIVKYDFPVEAPDGFNTALGLVIGSNSIEAPAGTIYFNDVNTYLSESATDNKLRIGNDHGYLDVGSGNVSYTHYTSSTGSHYFYGNLWVAADLGSVGGFGVGVSAGTAITNAQIYIADSNTRIYEGSGNAIRLYTNSGYIDVGPQNTTWAHFSTDRSQFHFNEGAMMLGGLTIGGATSGSVNPVDHNIRLYYNTTWIGQLSVDPGWLRLNQSTGTNVYTPEYIRASGGLMAGSAGTIGAGDVNYTGQLNSYKASTLYQVFAYYPLQTAFTSTSWDGDSFSTTGRTSLNWNTVFGVPSAARAVMVSVAIRDSGAGGGATAESILYIGGRNTSNTGSWIDAPPEANRWARGSMIVNCAPNSNTSYYNIIATGTGTTDIVMRVEGYFI